MSNVSNFSSCAMDENKHELLTSVTSHHIQFGETTNPDRTTTNNSGAAAADATLIVYSRTGNKNKFHPNSHE